jgi:putative transcriptional regulator
VSDVLDFRGGGVSSDPAEVPVMKNRLRVLRAEREWSQGDLAKRLEVSRQSVNAIETGKFDPSLPLAFKLARLFGMRIEEIFLDEWTDSGELR